MSDTSNSLLNELESARRTIAELQAQIAALESGQQSCPETQDGLEEIRMQIEQAHQEWMSALDAIDDPVFLHDSEFRILRANRAYQKLAGIPFKELIGKSYFEAFPMSSGPLPGCLHAMERGQDGEEETISFEGSFYRSRAFPVHNEQGTYLFSVHSLEDVTERIQMENSLLESRELLLAFIKESPIYAFLKEVSPVESKVLAASENYVNMIGIAAKEMIGKTMPELFPADFAAKITADDWSTVASGKVLHLDEELNGKSYITIKFPIPLGGKTYLAGYTIDITERKQHEITLQRANRALRTISAGNQALIHATAENTLLQEMCDVAVQVGGYRLAWIGYARDYAEQTIEQTALAGFEKGWPNPSPLTWNVERHGSCPAGAAIISSETKVVQDIFTNPELKSWHENARQYGYASCIALPLMDGGRAFGVMVLFDEKPDVFDDNEVMLLEEMSGDLSFGILTLRIKEAHSEHAQRLQKNMLQTVEAIASIVEMRDPYTSGHQKRVADLAQAIAKKMGRSEEEQQVIHLAGVVHDLGKISIPAEILSKPTRLNDIEYSLIKMHPQAGYDILKGIDFSWPIAQMVLQHHERMDGSGYPQGLAGDEILSGALILSVADVMEAMSSHRPYRAGLGIDLALEELARGRGTLYDAQVVDACTALFKEDGYGLPQ
ncbi:MAG: PAS domain-containing protein [Gammaproteobacteria bacterium]|nr:PAS domain-containing protein [Gammaproteobacteria bacterium]MBU1625231.1 PAS domain-containing protein [Gammaproteobacteria bacterium]MBU1981491.1 PAS domain-containing protein [Gammaproteobacteria bacterium]